MTNLPISNHAPGPVQWGCDSIDPNHSEQEACPYKHKRLKALPPEASLNLPESNGEPILQRRDADKACERRLAPALSKTPLSGTNIQPPQLKWQREALCLHIREGVRREYGEGAFAEIFYSGGKALKLALGEESYPKLCDTDIKVFLSGAPVEALEYVIKIVERFIKQLLARHLSCLRGELPDEWISGYMPKGRNRSIIDAEKGIYRASITFGGDEDWLVILDQDTGRLHSVTGKSLLLSIDTPVLVALEGGVEEALQCARMGIIKTTAPHELEGNACLSELELMTHGWAYPLHEPLLRHAFTACIATRCQDSPWLWSTYCKSHRRGWDYIGSMAFMLAGFFQVVTDPYISEEDKTRLLSQICKNIESCLQHSNAARNDDSLFLRVLASAIVEHSHEQDVIAAEVIFLMSLYPHSDHYSRNGLRKAVPKEEVSLSGYEGMAFLLIPRPSQKFPDRCYLPVPQDLEMAWRLLIKGRRSSQRGLALWEHLTAPLSIEDIHEIRDLLVAGSYRALVRSLLGQAFGERGFFDLFHKVPKANIAIKAAVVRLADSFIRAVGAVEERELGQAYIELKLITLQIILSNKKTLPTLGDKLVVRLTQLLGVAYKWDLREEEPVFEVIDYLLGILEKAGCSIPYTAGLKKEKEAAHYICDYYTACESCDKTTHLPMIHYKALANDQPDLFNRVAPVLLEVVYLTRNERLFEILWSLSLTKDLTGHNSLLASFTGYILSIDSSISQLYTLSASWISVIHAVEKREALEPLNQLFQKLFSEGTRSSYIYARDLYLAAADNKVFGVTKMIPLFKKIAGHFFDQRGNSKEIAWIPPALADLYKRGKYSLLKGDKELSEVIIALYHQLGKDCVSCFWSTPSAFLTLAEQGHRELVVDLYQVSRCHKDFDTTKEANITYALVKGLLASDQKEDIALAFSLWRSSRNIEHPNKSYREKMAALFVGWVVRTAGKIPRECQSLLCQTLDRALPASDLYKVSGKLLRQESASEEIWPYLSRWLMPTYNSGFIEKNHKEGALVRKDLCLAIRTGRATGLTLEDEIDWLSIAIAECIDDSASCARWLFDLLEKRLEHLLTLATQERGIPLKALEACLNNAKNQGILDVQVLSTLDMQKLFVVYNLLISQGIERPVQRFLDDCDALGDSFPQELIPLRMALRKMWLASISSEKLMTAKRANIIKKQMESLGVHSEKAHPDLEGKEIGQLYRSMIHFLLRKDAPKKALLQGGLLLKTLVEREKSNLLVEDSALCSYLEMFFYSESLCQIAPLSQIGWELITHPAVITILADDYIDQAYSFIRRYATRSVAIAEEVFQYLESQCDGLLKSLEKHLLLYTALVCGASELPDGFYFLSLHSKIALYLRAHDVVFFTKDVSEQQVLAAAFCAISTEIYQKKWSSEQLVQAKQMLLALIKSEQEEALYSQENGLLLLVGSFARHFLYMYESDCNTLALENQIVPAKSKAVVREVIRALYRTHELVLMIDAAAMFQSKILKELDATALNSEDLSLLEDLLTLYIKMNPAGEVKQLVTLSQTIQSLIVTVVTKQSYWPQKSREDFQLLWIQTLDFIVTCFAANYNPERDFIDNRSKNGREGVKDGTQWSSNPWTLINISSLYFRCLLWGSDEWLPHAHLCQKLWYRLLSILWETPFSNRRNSEERQVARLLSTGRQVFYDVSSISPDKRNSATHVLDPSCLNPLCRAVKNQMLANPYIKGCHISSSFGALRGCLDNMKKQLNYEAIKDLDMAIFHEPIDSFYRWSQPQSGESSSMSFPEEWLIFCVSVRSLLPKTQLTPEMQEVFYICEDWVLEHPENSYIGLILLATHASAVSVSTTKQKQTLGKQGPLRMEAMNSIILSADNSLARGFKLLEELTRAFKRQADAHIIREGEISAYYALLTNLWHHASQKDLQQSLEHCKAATEMAIEIILYMTERFSLAIEDARSAFQSIRAILGSTPWIQKNQRAAEWAKTIESRLPIEGHYMTADELSRIRKNSHT